MFSGVALQVLIGIAIFIVGSGIGWTVKDWKDGAEIASANAAKDKAELEREAAMAANGQCQTDIGTVRQSVAGIEKAAEERVKVAEAEMTKAQKTAAWHVNRAAEIRNGLTPRPNETQCQAVEREQMEYVAARRSELQ